MGRRIMQIASSDGFIGIPVRLKCRSGCFSPTGPISRDKEVLLRMWGIVSFCSDRAFPSSLVLS